jgi:hypothetical protein
VFWAHCYDQQLKLNLCAYAENKVQVNYPASRHAGSGVDLGKVDF